MLSVELLNVLHRLLLTRDSLASHVVIMSAVAHVVQGSRAVLERKRAESGASNEGNMHVLVDAIFPVADNRLWNRNSNAQSSAFCP